MFAISENENTNRLKIAASAMACTLVTFSMTVSLFASVGPVA